MVQNVPILALFWQIISSYNIGKDYILSVLHSLRLLNKKFYKK